MRWILVLMFLLAVPAWAEDLGELSANPFNPDSTSNPFGAGSPFKPDGINNPFSPYGSPFSNQSATNPFATDAPRGRNKGVRNHFLDGRSRAEVHEWTDRREPCPEV